MTHLAATLRAAPMIEVAEAVAPLALKSESTEAAVEVHLRVDLTTNEKHRKVG